MRIVTVQELESWLASGQVLEKDARGVKVIRLSDGDILKIFRSRRSPLVERLRPSARRFQRHAEQLQRLGIKIPQIRECLWIDRDKAVSACLYQPLQGTPLDRLFHAERGEFVALVPALAGYIHHLHRCGIYFRSLHLGNILRTPDQGFGLIDFLDIRFKGRPLGRMLVRRNFEHLRGYLVRRKVEHFPLDELLRAYERASRSSN